MPASMRRSEVLVPEASSKLAAYLFHGMDLTQRGKEAISDCPFCGKEGKWSASSETGQWHCWSCGEKGNVYTFLSSLWDAGERCTDPEALEALASERNYLGTDAAWAWGLRQSCITGEWLVPGCGPDGKLLQLCRYGVDFKTGKRRLFPTSGLSQQMCGIGQFDPENGTVFICEGAWDGIALWEALQCWDQGAPLNVVAVPGCSTFGDRWGELFRGREAVLFYHNDHPRVNRVTGKVNPPAGWEGMRRVAGILSNVAKKVSFLPWSGGDRDHDPSLKDGWDVRDHLGQGRDSEARVRLLQDLLARVRPVPAAWLGAGVGSNGAHVNGGNGRAPAKPKKAALQPLQCEGWRELVNQWRKGMRWTDDLDVMLSCMLAAVASIKQGGSQLWIKAMGPPSSGKTTLAESICVDRDGARGESLNTVSSLYSGYKMDREGSEDFSLALKLDGKLLVVVDGDTFLKSPNKDRLMSQLRELYDGVGRSTYGNGMGGEYVQRTGMLLCGTSELRELDGTELGERYVNVYMGDMDEELEDEVGWMVVNRMASAFKIRVTGKADDDDSPERIMARRMTGGVLVFLREHAERLIAETEFSDDALRECQLLGAFAVFMRARASRRQNEDCQKEMPFRLQEQMTKLAGFLAVAMGRGSVDGEVMRRVKKAALDTSRGKVLKLCRRIDRAGEAGAFLATLAHEVGETEDKLRPMLEHLRQVQALETFTRQAVSGAQPRKRWRLHPRLRRLWDSIMVDKK